MVIHALRHLPKAEAEKLRRILDMQTRDRVVILEAIQLIRKAGSIEYAKQVSRKLAERALRILHETLPEGAGRRKLEALAGFLITREY